MASPRLIILSDLFGLTESEWLDRYIEYFHDKFEIKVYDSRLLAGIDTSITDQRTLHSQFLDFGISAAVDSLSKLEFIPDAILGFSIGGTIAWQYACAIKLDCELICLSATRLRYEIDRPKGKVKLIYGSEDNYKPSAEWINKMQLEEVEIIENERHELYMNPSPQLLQSLKLFLD